MNKQEFVENNFFRPSWYSIFVNPYFIDRYAIFSAIRSFSKSLNTNTKILDIGCGKKPYLKLFKNSEYIGIDIQGGGHSDTEKIVDKYYDGEHIPFESNSFDVVICTQVLEHASNPDKLIAECARVLKPRGKIFLTMPFAYPEHEIPYDFQRFTRYGHEKILKANGFNSITIKKMTGFCGTFSQLASLGIFESIKFRSTSIKVLLGIFILAPIQIVGIIFDTLLFKAGITIGYVAIADKK